MSFAYNGAPVLRDFDLRVSAGESVALVGRTGCGKSTTGKCLIRLTDPTAGRILLEGADLAAMNSGQLRAMRRRMQFIFQDPFSSMNPRMRVRDIIGEPLRNFGYGREAIRERVAQLLARVSLRPDAADRYPHEFSGGQRQRIGIARALALEPSLIVCDEPVSALDVSIQAQIINLLMDLQDELGLSYLFIAHDLAVVERVSHRIAVMYLGKIVELTDRRSLFAEPLHPYSEALLSAVPVPDPEAKRSRIILTGDVPSPINPPPGCRFHTRCPHARERCREEVPALVADASGRATACHFWRELRAPVVAVGDSALGFWAAVGTVWPETREQRCWVHRLANVLDKLPKRLQPKAKQALHAIMNAPTRAEAEAGIEAFAAEYEAKYPKAVTSLRRDQAQLLTFYDFPAEHWRHLRTTNIIESPFATVRLRQRVTKGAGSRTKALMMAFKLLAMAEERWRKVNGSELLPLVRAGVRFVDGVQEKTRTAAGEVKENAA